MKLLALYTIIGTSFGLSTNKTKAVQSYNPVWFPLPEGFDQDKPDEILDLVSEAYQEQYDKMPFSHFYVFGDSACDSHNNFDANRGLEPDPKVYWRGRVSNGPMWPDYLEKRFGMTVKNYAYSGATINGSNYKFAENIPDFEKQVDDYELSMLNVSSPLAIVQWIGNDMINPNITSKKLASDIEGQLQRLVDLGEIRDILMVESTTIAYIDEGYNRDLVAMIKRFQKNNPEVTVTNYPIINDYATMISVPPPTADKGKWYAPPKPCYNKTSGDPPCSDPQNYFLYDLYHPSTVPSYNIAARMAMKIKSYFKR